MLRQIMVPTDGSPLSARALPLAEAIANAQGAEIVLVRVLEPFNPYGMAVESYRKPKVYDELVASLHSAASKELASMVDTITSRGGTARTMVLAGSPPDGLLRAEAELQPDLVVMASHGRSGLARFALGSVAERLVREGNTPVLIVHSLHPLDQKLDFALVPLDGSPLAEQAIPMVETLAGQPVRQVRLMRAVTRPEEATEARRYLEGIRVRLQSADLEVTTEVRVDNPVAAIRDAAERADLIVLATHGRGGFDRLRHGSVAEQITREAHLPVLLVRPAGASERVVTANAVPVSIV
jgi:nucleotide-binding universal stress UspA family protein